MKPLALASARCASGSDVTRTKACLEDDRCQYSERHRPSSPLMCGPPASTPCLNPAQSIVGHSRCLEKGATPGRAAKERPQMSKPLSIDLAKGQRRNDQFGF